VIARDEASTMCKTQSFKMAGMKNDEADVFLLHVLVVKVWRTRSIFSILACSLRFQDRPVNIDSGPIVSPEPSIAATSGPSLLTLLSDKTSIPYNLLGKKHIRILLGIVILPRAAPQLSHVSLPPP
jgi:hypothetical protein